MARLVCPQCRTVHRVTVVQDAYRELPCRSCGTAIPLTLAEPSSASLPAAPAEAPPADAVPPPAAPGSRRTEDATSLSWDARIQLDAPESPRNVAPVSEVAVAPAAAPPADRPPCPHCQKRLQPGAVKCPHCRRFLKGGPAPRESTTRALLWAIGVAALAIALLVTLLVLRTPRVP